MQYKYNLPLQNITYIHVHKCGGTSIQGAFYRRARHLRNMAFRFVVDNNGRDAWHLNPQQRHQQTSEKQDTDTALIKLQANVHAYRHSFGGGSLRKKDRWDAERLDHVHAIFDSQQSSLSFHSSSVLQDVQQQHQKSSNDAHVIFTVVRDPIQRFLSAIQQVMQYNVEFRQKCLFEDKEKEMRREQQSLSFFQLPSWSMLLKWRRNEDQEEKVHNYQEIFAQRQKSLRRRTIQCSIQDMEHTSYRKDVHLQPMVSHFRLLDCNDGIKNRNDANATIIPFATATAGEKWQRESGGIATSGRGIAVSVFSMEDIPHVLAHLLQDDDDDDGAKNDTVKASTIHMRDRSNEEYATSPILSQLSSRDCDETMIRQICKLYHVDVELMKWLGFGGEAVERC